MIRLKMPAGVAAVAVALVSVLAPSQSDIAIAQTGPMVAPDTHATVEHTQPAAEERVPEFITRAVVQPAAEAEPEILPPPPARAASLRALVAAMPRDGALDEQLECLARAIYFEARGEPLYGQLAVAEVIINRAASGRFPASYCGVVTQRSQFSFVKAGRMPQAPTGSTTYKTAKAIALIAHRDLWDSEAKDALFFHATHVSPGWRGKKLTARINNHVFYR
ncbi:cell wall hydrolase [Qipengyuania sediminis]|uniref:cell wall hydrolase n=1 Tax=Qipengyuania sediminis TaxID=1532023 RepID=UPI001F0D3500|nr:cell wall hydrolase [Qipengyuania sediminis]